ncbi:MAG: hypothetical protein ACKORC_07830 [Acidimicrobiia bacterium]
MILLAASQAAVVFATISIVSAAVLALLVLTQERGQIEPDSAAAFRRHLAALGDDSREMLRSQLRVARERQLAGHAGAPRRGEPGAGS